ncbi:hypothetical protein PoB_004367300 [Plakobranchus ocellatus]|uniref:Uncharacterized protein n=1 Tax=Plakobranchus ocellatus TaxID=259542 RepID=A0AAV4BC82_9GAST|nr:hypothetical protein PoB_004367300 [Plakobranchus ocellatus]
MRITLSARHRRVLKDTSTKGIKFIGFQCFGFPSSMWSVGGTMFSKCALRSAATFQSRQADINKLKLTADRTALTRHGCSLLALERVR